MSEVEYFPLTTENTISQNLRNIKLGNFENNQKDLILRIPICELITEEFVNTNS